MEQPVVGLLDLVAVADLLTEHAVLVPQPVADRRDLERRQRVEETGGQPAQAAVAQPGVGLRLQKLVPVLVRIRPQVLVNERLDLQVGDRVQQGAADQELHRQVINLLGVRTVVDRLREQPALGQQVAERAGHRLESLPLVRLLHRDDVVEDQVAIVVVTIGEPEFCLVLLQTFLGRQAGHVLCPFRARIRLCQTARSGLSSTAAAALARWLSIRTSCQPVNRTGPQHIAWSGTRVAGRKGFRWRHIRQGNQFARPERCQRKRMRSCRQPAGPGPCCG